MSDWFTLWIQRLGERETVLGHYARVELALMLVVVFLFVIAIRRRPKHE